MQMAMAISLGGPMLKPNQKLKPNQNWGSRSSRRSKSATVGSPHSGGDLSQPQGAPRATIFRYAYQVDPWAPVSFDLKARLGPSTLSSVHRDAKALLFDLRQAAGRVSVIVLGATTNYPFAATSGPPEWPLGHEV
jgi:hypothetical protein